MFAEVTIGCEMTGAEIYVDDSYKGIGRWSGRLLAGNHKVEARKANHVSSQNVFTAKEGETMRWSLDVPVARTGKVQVSTNVLGGEVYVNGTLQGEAPMSD